MFDLWNLAVLTSQTTKEPKVTVNTNLFSLPQPHEEIQAKKDPSQTITLSHENYFPKQWLHNNDLRKIMCNIPSWKTSHPTDFSWRSILMDAMVYISGDPMSACLHIHIYIYSYTYMVIIWAWMRKTFALVLQHYLPSCCLVCMWTRSNLLKSAWRQV